jgi:hypothetical protein
MYASFPYALTDDALSHLFSELPGSRSARMNILLSLYVQTSDVSLDYHG